jgi:hypothetical protein
MLDEIFLCIHDLCTNTVYYDADHIKFITFPHWRYRYGTTNCPTLSVLMEYYYLFYCPCDNLIAIIRRKHSSPLCYVVVYLKIKEVELGGTYGKKYISFSTK